MPYVSVGQVENIGEAIAGLHTVASELETACNSLVSVAEDRLDQAQQEADNSSQLLENAIDAESEAAIRLETAEEQLASANARLDAAQSSLSICEASGFYDEFGNYIPPICYTEEAEVSNASLEVSAAESEVAIAKQELDLAKENRIRMEQRNDMAHRCLDLASNLCDNVRSECSTRLSQANDLVSSGNARLQNAQSSLNEYLGTNQQAQQFNSWIKWSPQTNTPITPKDVNARLNLSCEQQKYFIEYMIDRDPMFRKKIQHYKDQLDSANGQAETHAIQLKMRKNLSGFYYEKLAEYALKPLGHNMTYQRRSSGLDGRYTKTDLIIEDLKVPVILGRGERLYANTGGSIAIEVKSGKSSYIISERGHMSFQAEGHRSADASMILCTRDIKELSPEKENELRQSLRKAGSPIIGMLPAKHEIDKLCWEFVANIDNKQGLHDS